MLCWICPECGRDCSPAVRECPSCTQRQGALTNGVLSMLEALRAAPPVPLLASAPQQYLLFGLTNGHSSTTTETAVLAEEEPAVPASETIDSLVRPLVESAKAAPPVEVAPVEITPAIHPLNPSASEPPSVSVPPIAEPAAFLRAPVIEPAVPTAAEPPAAIALPADPTSFSAPAIRITKLAIPAVSPATAAPVEPAVPTAAEPSDATALPADPASFPASPIQITELVIPAASPVKPVPPVEPASPPAAEPTAAVLPSWMEPPSLHAPSVQFVELKAPLAPPTKTAPLIEPAHLPAAEPTAAKPPSPAEPPPLLSPAVKFVELPLPPNPPAKAAPPIEYAGPAAAQPPTQIAPLLAEPALFPAPALQIVQLETPAPAPSFAKTAPRIELPNLAAVKPPVTAAPTVAESAPFAAPALQLPELLPVAEPFWAAAGLANQALACSEALALQAEALLDEIGARIEADESKIRAIVAAFQVRPRLSLLPAPREVVAAPAPPDFEWLKMPRPVLPTRKPSDLKVDSLTAPPQKLPLAGPCLPPELRNFIEAPPAEYVRAKSGIGLAAWIVSLVIATSVFMGAGAVMQRVWSNRDAKAASVAPSPGQAVASTPAAPSFEQHPFARFVEVTGLRVVADVNHRSQVQYIVVNHSATQLTGMSLKIAVRSSENPAGSAPLFTVSAVVPSLGPHQSKEIRTDLDSQLRTSAIPDWEYLRTDVQVGTQN